MIAALCGTDGDMVVVDYMMGAVQTGIVSPSLTVREIPNLFVDKVERCILKLPCGPK